MGWVELAVARSADVDSLAAKTVLLVIASHVNGDGAAWPSIQLLANETTLSRRSVFRAIRELEEKKLLSVDRHAGRISVFKLSPGGDTQPPVTHQGVHHVHGGVTQRHQRGDTASPRTIKNSNLKKSVFKPAEIDEIRKIEASLAALDLAGDDDPELRAELATRLRVLLGGGEA
jgi:DNA-binding transcriptional MocR family regulator